MRPDRRWPDRPPGRPGPRGGPDLPVQPRPRPVREYPETVYLDDYAGAYEPWSAGWYEYCSDRYRSFNPRSGTFVGYDGAEHFCVAN